MTIQKLENERKALDFQFAKIIEKNRYLDIMHRINHGESVDTRDRNWYNKNKHKSSALIDHLKENELGLKILKGEFIDLKDCRLCFDMIRKVLREHLYSPEPSMSPVFLVRAVRIALSKRYSEVIHDHPIPLHYRDNETIFTCKPDGTIMETDQEGITKQFKKY